MSEQMRREQITVPVEVRPVRPDDAAAVNLVYREAWLSAYPNEQAGITYEDVDAETRKWLTPEDVALKELKYQQIPEGTFNSVAVVGGLVVANSVANIFSEQSYNKIQTMYVLPEYHGTGVAQELFDVMLDYLGSDKPVRLEVATYNQRAINFYKKYGFEILERGPLRTECQLPSGKILPEYVMHLPSQNQ